MKKLLTIMLLSFSLPLFAVNYLDEFSTFVQTYKYYLDKDFTEIHTLFVKNFGKEIICADFPPAYLRLKKYVFNNGLEVLVNYDKNTVSSIILDNKFLKTMKLQNNKPYTSLTKYEIIKALGEPDAMYDCKTMHKDTPLYGIYCNNSSDKTILLYSHCVIYLKSNKLEGISFQ